MLDFNKIYCMDCLEGMKTIPDNSVDLVVTDPPYYKIMITEYNGNNHDWDNQWDSFEDYLKWCRLWFNELKRVLKDNGSLYIFADDKISAYIQIELDKIFKLENNIIWVKPNNMTIKGWNGYNSYSPITERILFYSNDYEPSEWNKTGYDRIYEEHIKPKSPMAKYLREEFKRADITCREISKLFPSKTGGLTGCVSNWLNGDNFPLKEQYLKMREYLNNEYLRKEYEYLRKEYEDLRKEYEDLRRPFNPKKNYTDVWTFNITSSSEKTYHPTQKPIKLIKRIIDTSSKEKGLILDLFMGSGTTAVACKQLNRNFIGFEISQKYVDIANKRLEQSVLRDFK